MTTSTDASATGIFSIIPSRHSIFARVTDTSRFTRAASETLLAETAVAPHIVRGQRLASQVTQRTSNPGERILSPEFAAYGRQYLGIVVRLDEIAPQMSCGTT
jgi:hypothetical protein